MLHCFRCSADLPDNLAYCLHCGARLDDGEQETVVRASPSFEPPGSRSRVPTYAAVAILALVTAVGLLVLALAMQSDAPPPIASLPANKPPPTSLPVVAEPPPRISPSKTPMPDDRTPPPPTAEPPAATPIATRRSTTLSSADQPFNVGPGKYASMRVTAAVPSYLTGTFTAAGGAGDIGFVLVEAGEFENWKRGEYRFVEDVGYTTGVNINRRLPPGDYVMIFDNRKALITAKLVSASFVLSPEMKP